VEFKQEQFTLQMIWNDVSKLLEYEVIWGHIDILIVAVRRLSNVGGGR